MLFTGKYSRQNTLRFFPFDTHHELNKSPLILNVPCISESCLEIKIKLNFYFHTSLWCLKKFYEGLKGLHKILGGTTKKCENKNLS